MLKYEDIEFNLVVTISMSYPYEKKQKTKQ